MMKPYKIRVPNERVHVLIQEKLFRLGFTWAEGQKTVLNDLAKNNYILTVSTNILFIFRTVPFGIKTLPLFNNNFIYIIPNEELLSLGILNSCS